MWWDWWGRPAKWIGKAKFLVQHQSGIKEVRETERQVSCRDAQCGAEAMWWAKIEHKPKFPYHIISDVNPIYSLAFTNLIQVVGARPKLKHAYFFYLSALIHKVSICILKECALNVLKDLSIILAEISLVLTRKQWLSTT